MEAIYRHVGISRQGYFDAKQCQDRENVMMQEIEKLVVSYRADKDRRAGSRMLYYNLNIKDKFGIGVNKFERLMSEYGHTLLPLRVRIVTTKSIWQSWNYPDLTPGMEVDSINQLVVGDLTYITIGTKVFYMFCLIDLYSARIVGFSIGNRMTASQAILALEMWFDLRGQKNLIGCIHHTDGGSQYFSKPYMGSVMQSEIKISVAKNCLDNGHAEQRNGLIKHHLIPTINFKKTKQLRHEIEKTIYFYNYERKQEALGWLSPVEYEEKWLNKGSRPVLIMQDRSDGKCSERVFRGIKTNGKR